MSEPLSPLVQLDPPIADERGALQVLLNKEIKSTVLITSKKGTVRANHYHTKDWHYCYVLSGSIEYHYRLAGSSEEPKRITIRAGEMFFTPPMVEHAMVFPEETTFLALAGEARDQESYEADVVRVELIKTGG